MIYQSSDQPCKGESPPAVDSVGVNSKKKFFKSILECKEVFFIILATLTAAISKTLSVHFNKCRCSSKLLFHEYAFMLKKRDNNLFFQKILEFEVGKYHSN